MRTEGTGQQDVRSREILTQIDRLAAEILEDESRLRRELIEMIGQGQTDEAIRLLEDWNAMSAGDVLEKHSELLNA